MRSAVAVEGWPPSPHTEYVFAGPDLRSISHAAGAANLALREWSGLWTPRLDRVIVFRRIEMDEVATRYPWQERPLSSEADQS
jgi:hypothetical protein